ncbi:hypothetical protein [Bacillus sp. S/N-304-OC-R1]|uniref:hypothetical protein n=1 Tax=Bacillus sp. S/N-304-OC-R1 TaxID=2758034 RepID=UPI001C8E238C|nr:hypothetical protein [Bacillus sp. S/N-304-OC-R1]MBY0122274.1 hypothetical protein [Bacillus sp. S/N-304-OC-R1]
MKGNLKWAWTVSWLALVGQLVVFLGISIFTGNWLFVMWSFMVSLLIGIPSMMNTWKAQKKTDENKL